MNPWLVFAGTKKGGVFRSIDRGNNWSESLAGVEIPRQTISRIACHPQNSQVAMLTVPVSPKTPWVVRRERRPPIENYYPMCFCLSTQGSPGRTPTQNGNFRMWLTHRCASTPSFHTEFF